MYSVVRRWLRLTRPAAVASVGEIKPTNGPAKFSFALSYLPTAVLRDRQPFSLIGDRPEVRGLMEEAQRSWDQAAREAERHWDALARMQGWSPYPTRCFCLGAAEMNEDGRQIRVRYFLFATDAPADQGDAIAQVAYEAKVGAMPGEFERVWIDALREDELSDDNRRQVGDASR